MSLIEFNADLRFTTAWLERIEHQLERIADAMDRAFPPVPQGEEDVKPFTAADYSQANEDSLLEAEIKELLKERNPNLKLES